jgi:CARDB
MQRVLLTIVLALAAAGAIAPAAEALPPGGARAVLVTCDRIAHEAAFDGRMAAGEETSRMQMRFALQDRVGHAHRFKRVRIPGFGAWQTSEAGRSRYVYTKRIEGLVGPASYRVVVRFRWLDADGDVLRTARAVSRPCWQPDARPDLSVDGIEVRPTPRPDRLRYAVTVLNSGRTAAGESRLALDLGDGGMPLSAVVDELAAGESRTVVVPGRPCTPGAVLTATADAGDAVDEHDEDDDTLAVICPPPA